MVPRLQFERGISAFFRFHRGHQFASSALMQPMTDAFVKAVEKFVAKNGIYYHRFRKGERKDDIALARLAKWGCKEGVVFVGWAQEKTRVLGPRPPSTTRAISASASDSRTSPPCGRSASKPTDVFSTSSASVTTALSASISSPSSLAPLPLTANASLLSVSSIPPCKAC
jgi:hypothetical protein